MISTRLNDDTLATVLLCSGLGAPNRATSPLSDTEWNRLVRSLMRASWRPGDVLRWGADAARDALGLDEPTATRLEELLGQAVPVAAEIERLERSGIVILSRSDDAYPSRWRARLRELSPPLVFVAGPVSLFARGGIAVVGSRKVDEAGATFARDVGRATAGAGAVTISGGARGVDREAMFGGLERGGGAVGILADSLARTLRSPEVRTWVAEGQLALASPSRPDAGFKVWRAMGRNKLIYTLADAAVVVSSEENRGGTWAGAIENLKHDWTPLFVRNGDETPAGNRRLIEWGALPLGTHEVESAESRGFLPHLLNRAEHEASKPSSGPSQQSFVDDDEIGSSPTPLLRKGELGADQDSSSHEPDTRQMLLIAES
jgi:predicted Rossmann fold nucleotide-binding protein DprA/Smf involved in DNA uptake